MSRHKCQVRLHGIETLGQVGRVGLTKNVPIETGWKDPDSSEKMTCNEMNEFGASFCLSSIWFLNEHNP